MGVINGLVDEYVELAIDSFDVLHAGLRLSHPSGVCGRVNSGYPGERRSLTGRMDPETDVAAFSGTSSLRPVMYTLAPFAAKA